MSHVSELARLTQEHADRVAGAEAICDQLYSAREKQDAPEVRRLKREHQRALAAVSLAKRQIELGKFALGSANQARKDAAEASRKQAPERAVDSEREKREAAKRERIESFANRFVSVARDMLDPDVFEALFQETTLRANRDLIRYQHRSSAGAAMPPANAQFVR